MCPVVKREVQKFRSVVIFETVTAYLYVRIVMK